MVTYSALGYRIPCGAPAAAAVSARLASKVSAQPAEQKYLVSAPVPRLGAVAGSTVIPHTGSVTCSAGVSTRGSVPVRAARGSGTFVEPKRISYPIRQRTRFSEIVGATGRAPSGRLIASALEAADAEIAGKLGLKPGSLTIRIELLRHADRIPICAATSWVPAARFPGAARVYSAAKSMTRMLAHFGVNDYTRKSTRISAAIADGSDAATLKVMLGRPILMIDSVDVDADGCPMLTTRARFAADRLELVIES